MSISKWFFAPRAVALALVLMVFGAADALAQTFAYVANIADNTVSVINTATNMVTATIPVSAGPLSVVATPDGSTVYVGAINAGAIDVIDTSTNTVE
jgi:YVTN family beta-propeller protein